MDVRGWSALFFCGGTSHRLPPRAIVNSMQLWRMWSQSFSPRKKNQKRASSDQPMLERAVKAGVTDRLKPIPQRLLEATTAGRLSRLQQNPCSFLFAAMLGSTEHHHFAEIESCGTNM